MARRLEGKGYDKKEKEFERLDVRVELGSSRGKARVFVFESALL